MPVHNRWFSFKLGQGDGSTPRSKPGDRLKAESLVESSPYQLETHMAHTKDGFVLVLHRLVPRQASGAGEGNNGSGNGGKRSSFGMGFGRSNSSSSNNSAVRVGRYACSSTRSMPASWSDSTPFIYHHDRRRG